MANTIADIQNELDALRQAGKYKKAPLVDGPMGPVVHLADGGEVVNLCSNNYLGLANHPVVLAGAKRAIETFGYGTASVRFICGSFTVHRELEREIADFLGMDSATTYTSCWNANEALLPTLLGEGDAVISDELNHASIVDSCRLCGKKIQRLIYKHSDMSDLEAKLARAIGAKRKIVITDGVFSMEGDLANLPVIVGLANKYGSLVAVDDSHAHGVLGRTGRGTPEHFGVAVDIVTGTLGKTLGGSAGGFIAGSRPIIELLVQKSRPQLFSNALPPAVAGGALAALRLLVDKPELLSKLRENVIYLRDGLSSLGFNVLDSASAIIPIIVGETVKALELSKEMLNYGILITGFGYPVVPEGIARLRAQVSAAHTKDHLDKTLKAFDILRGKMIG